MTHLYEEIKKKKEKSSASNVVNCLCFSVLASLVPIALINCYFFLIYSSFVDDEAALYYLHSSSGTNISAQQYTPERCDISKGKWVYDPQPPLYTNDTCQYIQGHQNCMKNGRPDRGFLNWRWQPEECNLPKFNSHQFLDLMRNKKMMFIGDSIARNHMQSLLCAISQIEKPKNIFRDPLDKDVTWLFPSYNFTLTIFWSPFLVKHKPLVENGTTLIHIHLDSPEEIWKSCLSEYDVTVLSTGPWYFKGSIYYVNNEIIGCHHCMPPRENMIQLGFTNAYKMALNNVLDFMTKHEGYKGTTVFRTFSVEHFENGEWWNGGNCNRTRPFENQTLEMPWMASEMHRIQVEELAKWDSNPKPNGSRVKLVDITYSAYLRPDGHPGFFRTFHPDLSGPIQSDCLHWCLPGPIDMWNEIILKMLLEGNLSL